tara:strand:- start:37203 stop:37832 length:630 start_codon:yes stop_codon:yes gene_type:complete
MKRFSIFKKSSQFYWSNNRVIYPIIFTCTLILVIKNGSGILEKNFLNNTLLGMMLITVICGIILGVIGIPKTEPLKGKIDGFLTFEMNSIEIGNKVFEIEKIKNIEISNDDYYGKIVASVRGNFNSPRSNGVANFIKLKLYSGELKMCNYELYNSNDIQKIRDELINYYLNEKIELDNLANILGEKSESEIAELKFEIEKKSQPDSADL